MEFWQYPLTFIVAMLIALFVGISGAYLIIRFIYKDDRFPFLKLHVLLFGRNPGVLILGGQARQTTIKSNPPLKISESPEYPIHEERKGARGVKMLFSLLMKAELGEKE